MANKKIPDFKPKSSIVNDDKIPFWDQALGETSYITWQEINTIIGSVGFSTTSVKTSNYSASSNELIPVDTTTGSVVITLPSAPVDKTVVAVKHVIKSGANVVIVNTSGSDVYNISGGTTMQTLTLADQSVCLQYESSTGIWYVVSNDLSLSQLDSRFESSANKVQNFNTISSDLYPSTQAIVNEYGSPFTPLGHVVSDDFARASLGGDYSQVGSQFTIDNNELLLTGGTPAGPFLTSYITYEARGVCNLGSFTKTLPVTVGVIGANTWGVAIGTIGAGTMVNGIQAGIALDTTNLGKITFYRDRHPTNGIDVSPNGMDIQAGDTLMVSLTYSVTKITCSVFNTRTGLTNQHSKVLYLYNNATYNRPLSAYKFAFFSMGGTHRIGSYTITSNDRKDSDYLILGDSISMPFSIDNPYNGWIGSVVRNTGVSITVNAGEGNKIEDLNVTEALSLVTPGKTKVCVFVGFNNAAAGDSVSTFETKHNTLINALVSGGLVLGTDLFINNITPSSATANLIANIPLFNANIASRINKNYIIDFHSILKNTAGTGLRVGTTIDDYHPAFTGQKDMCDRFISFFGIPIKNPMLLNYFPLFATRTGKYLFTNVETKRAQSPIGVAEFWGAGVDSQIGIATSDGGTSVPGIFIASRSGVNGEMLQGCYWNGTNYTATSTIACAVQMNFGIITLYRATGITAGSTFAFSIGSGISYDSGGLNLGSNAFKRTVAAISGTSQTGVVNTRYQPNNASLTTISLPTTAAVGDTIEVIGNGAGGWRISQAASQVIYHLTDTTVGTGGSLASTGRRDAVKLSCVVANTEWNVVSFKGTLIVT